MTALAIPGREPHGFLIPGRNLLSVEYTGFGKKFQQKEKIAKESCNPSDNEVCLDTIQCIVL